ncbi:MAG: endonuclease [Crocinitomicaceae bacterium]|nr:endonuclease [Crocinitomicaceae bacterium]|tara:strand:+ start:8221 stop:9240 length:1020 start_codon:yes stop_codon:yes gene_type:complete
MKFFLWISVITLFAKSGCTSSDSGKPSNEPLENQIVQIAFYNVENLFDTINEAGKNDGEYTPGGKKAWNTSRYYEKLDHLNQVLASIDSAGELVAFGVAEIENIKVLKDLVNTGFLKDRNYKIVHQESPDFRGIDVAFLYNSKQIKVNNSQWINVDLQDSGRTTRDILRADVTWKNEEITFYINHWPSRWGGKEKTNTKRIAASQALRNNIDAMKEEERNNHLVIMGDFNDYPNNESMLKILKADSLETGALYNATWPAHKNESIGSHNYKGHWGMLDQIVVSNSVVPFVDSVYVFKKNFMCYKNKKGEWLPSRTHAGPKYYGGYSDHLPVVLRLKSKK